MNSDVEKIKERLDIVEVVGEYITLQKAGKNMRGLSPFTNEKSPSFFVSPDRQLFHCFSSGKGGDMFSFVQEVEGVDFRGSLKLLADKAGITITQRNNQERKHEEVLYTILDDATTFYQKQLLSDKQAREYLEGRGITTETIYEWRLGYAPDEWRSTLEYLKGKGYSDGDIGRVGLIKQTQNDKGTRYYDTFRGRVMFPLFDISGRVIAYSGRILAKNVDAPKYVNSPETPLFNKSEVLYGLDKAKTSIRRQNYVILVEGQMDVVMSHQAGLKNTVASSGTALTEIQLGKLKRYTSRLIVAFDSDGAGFRASAKNAELAMVHGFDVKVAPLPADADPADMIKDDSQAYKDVLAKSQHIVDFYVDRIIADEKDDRVVARRIREEVLPLITGVTSAIEKAHFVGRVATRAHIPEEAVWEDFKSVEAERKSERPQTSQVAPERKRSMPTRRESIFKEIYGIVLWQKETDEPSIEIDAIENRWREIMGEEGYARRIEEYQGVSDQLLFEAETRHSENEDLKIFTEDLLSRLDGENIREEFNETKKALARAEKEGDAERTSTLLAKCQELTKKLANI